MLYLFHKEGRNLGNSQHLVWCFVLFCAIGVLEACGPSGAKVAAVDLNERFVYALYTANLPVVDSCLAAGADVNARDVNEVPAIIIAANTGNQEIVKKLLTAGADINIRSPLYYNSTALMEVAANQNVEMAKLLIDNGADVHLVDSFGDPAINWASYYGHVPLVDLLVQKGASWEVESEHGSAIEVAMKQWNDELLSYFIDKGAGEPLTGEEKALAIAIRQGDLDAAKQLIGKGGSVDLKDELATPILINAASGGNVDMVNLLISKGVNLDVMNKVGQTAIGRAAYFGHLEVVKALLNSRVDVNLTDEKYELSPLISAAAGGNPEIGQLLIDQGAELDHQEGISGFTPLMMATAYRQVEFVQMLLEAGANPYIKTMEGMTLSDMVGYANNPQIAEMIQQYLMKN